MNAAHYFMKKTSLIAAILDDDDEDEEVDDDDDESDVISIWPGEKYENQPSVTGFDDVTHDVVVDHDAAQDRKLAHDPKTTDGVRAMGERQQNGQGTFNNQNIETTNKIYSNQDCYKSQDSVHSSHSINRSTYAFGISNQEDFAHQSSNYDNNKSCIASSEPDFTTKQRLPYKPKLPPKPELPAKPEIPPKPQIPPKPEIPPKPKLPPKPSIPAKPQIPPKPKVSSNRTISPEMEESSKPELPPTQEISKPEVQNITAVPPTMDVPPEVAEGLPPSGIRGEEEDSGITVRGEDAPQEDEPDQCDKTRKSEEEALEEERRFRALPTALQVGKVFSGDFRFLPPMPRTAVRVFFWASPTGIIQIYMRGSILQ